MTAREARGLSQSALASRVGVTQVTISRIEKGDLLPSDDLAARIADGLEVPVSLLKVSMRSRELPVAFYRRKLRVSATQLKAIRARADLLRFRLGVLLTDADAPDLRIVIAGQSGGKARVRQAARALRSLWNVPAGPVANLIQLVEAAGIFIMPFDFGSESVDGLSVYSADDGLPPVILHNPALPADRLRFTIAHELGHLVLHHHLAVPQLDVDSEGEAHAFAAEFLMPADDIGAQLGNLTLPKLSALKLRWRVSIQALIMRARELERISDSQKRYLFAQLSQLGYRKREPVAIAIERATLFTELVEFCLASANYSDQQLSTRLHLYPFEFRRLFRAGQPQL